MRPAVVEIDIQRPGNPRSSGLSRFPAMVEATGKVVNRRRGAQDLALGKRNDIWTFSGNITTFQAHNFRDFARHYYAFY
ncbi:hypothetical protein [Aurantivibrio plasticivorans]